jgi:hypothetical protein
VSALSRLAVAMALGVIGVLQLAGAIGQQLATARDRQHGLDFDIGRWRTDTARRLHPLSGSSDWIEMHGTTIVGSLWNGLARLAEFKSDGPDGHLELLSLRLHDAQARHWSLNFAYSRDDVLGTPMIGELRHGRGEFYDEENIDGRTVLVRLSTWCTGTDRAQSEQAFSTDGGRTWEVNWINRYTRIRA